LIVAPAKAGAAGRIAPLLEIPAFAGMTDWAKARAIDPGSRRS